MDSLSSFDNSIECFLMPLRTDSPWCPQNVDKVRELLAKVKRPSTSDQQQLEEKQQNIYREMLKPHYPELCDVDELRDCKIQLVQPQDSQETSSKIAKIQPIDNKENDKQSQVLINHQETEIENSQNTNNQPIDSVTKLFIDSAESLQLLKDNGQKFIDVFCLIENDSEKLRVCSSIKRCIGNEKLRNIITFLASILNVNNYKELSIFIENVVFKSLLEEDLGNYPDCLPLIVDIQANDEEFVTKKFLIAYISKSEELIINGLPFLSKLATQLQQADHKSMVISAYLRNKKQILCDEAQLVYLESILHSSEFEGLKESVILQLLTSYIFESMQINEKSTVNFNKNAKLGKFLLNLVKKLPTEIPAVIYAKLSQAVDLHQSFLKKSIANELRKKAK